MSKVGGNMVKQESTDDKLLLVKRTSSSQHSIMLESDSLVLSNYQAQNPNNSNRHKNHKVTKMPPGNHNSQQNIQQPSRMQKIGSASAVPKYESTQPTTMAPNSGEPTLDYNQTKSQTVRDGSSN